MTGAPARPTAHHRRDYRRFFDMETRWNDMDLYGHMNNVVYMEYFDSALNRALIGAGALDLHGDGPIGVVAQSYTHYFSEVAYPDRVTVGVRVDRIGNTSLSWGFALFREDEERAAAQGGYVHVYVDRKTRRPVPLGPQHRAIGERLLVLKD